MSEREKPQAVAEPTEKTDTIVKSIVANLEKSYSDQKAKEIQNLYNAFVDAIAKQNNPHIANILTAIELVKIDLLTQKLEQIRREQAAQPAQATQAGT